ncbi:ATP-binding protein [Mesorhizobium sp. M1006]|uniref:ATP-binding protein n=1 Tax=Mesorhizobium sp. M1006 TaxID=2957048 RepID=UPI00333789A7
MAEFEPRPLHLHTLDSLVADLVSGRSILAGEDDPFILDDRSRSALQWYRQKGPNTWTANVSVAHAEDLVSAIAKDPPEVAALPFRAANATARRLSLKRLEAHRFAGLHKFGTPELAPENYVHEFGTSITLFEGRNGSGKTSLANAIIWALTGELLRAQREPEKANTDFDCWVIAEDGGTATTTHRMSPVTPMPNVDRFRPDQAWVPTDTWVELTFADEDRALLPPIRRSQTRSAQGKLTETPPDLSMFNIDPIALRIGTIMPGLLPVIEVGKESELGWAVCQLTGLSALLDLADHCRRSKTKISGEFIKTRTADRDRADTGYNMAKGDLEKELEAHPSLRPELTIPAPSEDKTMELTLARIAEHFETAKSRAFESARTTLGQAFDPADLALRTDLEKNISRALDAVAALPRLASAARLYGLRSLSIEVLAAAKGRISEILAEAKTLEALARDPSVAARQRLYARVVTWIADHPDPQRRQAICVVCSHPLDDALDPVTGRPVTAHLHDAQTDANRVSQTLRQWSENTIHHLISSLSEPLQKELSSDLPEHPCDLLRSAIVEELFAQGAFKGVLSELKKGTAAIFDETIAKRSDLEPAMAITLPANCEALRQALERLDLALRFARWRHDNDPLAREIVARVLGRTPKDGEPAESRTLTGNCLTWMRPSEARSQFPTP